MAAAAGSSTHTHDGDAVLRDRLHRFYTAYAPEKIANIDNVVKTYRSKPDELFDALEAKYGPEPPRPHAAPAVRRTAVSDENQDDDRDRSLSHSPRKGIRFSGAEEVSNHFAPSASAAYTETQQSSQSSASFAAASDTSGTAAAAGAADAAASSDVMVPVVVPEHPATELLQRQRTRERLIAFYKHYAPEKVAQADVALAAYKGREAVMFELLEAKYGPEAAVYRVQEEVGESTQDRELRAMINASIALSPKTRPIESSSGRARDAAAPFDYVVAAQLLGPKTDVGIFGPGHERYAAAFILMMHAIGPDDLFDATQATIPMPTFADRESTSLDRFAFERVLHFRFVWIDAWFKGLAIRNHELAARRDIIEEMGREAREIRYREYVRSQAFSMIVPIEAERRDLIQDDQRVRYEGLLTWFRRTRDELLLQRIRTSADIIVRPKNQQQDSSFSPKRNVMTQEQSDIQKVLRTAGEALRRSVCRSPSTPNRQQHPSPSRSAELQASYRSPADNAAGASARRSTSAADLPPPFVVCSPGSRRAASTRPVVTAADELPTGRSHAAATDYSIPAVSGRGGSSAPPPLEMGFSSARHRSAHTTARAASPSASSSRFSSSQLLAGSGPGSFQHQARRVAGARGQFSSHTLVPPPAASSTRGAGSINQSSTRRF